MIKNDKKCKKMQKMQNYAKKCTFEEFWATGLWSNPLLIYGAENFWWLVKASPSSWIQPGRVVAPPVRPKQSRWQHAHLRDAIHEEKAILTEQEWLRYVDSKPMSPKELQQRADVLAAAVVPVKQAIDSKKLRMKMQRQLRWTRKRKPQSTMALLGVVARTTQYVSKTAPVKFERNKDGTVREFTVLHASQGFFHLQEDQTGEKLWKHESFLKQMPRSLPPDDQQMPTPKRAKSVLAAFQKLSISRWPYADASFSLQQRHVWITFQVAQKKSSW